MTLLLPKDLRVAAVLVATLMIANGSPVSIPKERRIGEGWIFKKFWAVAQLVRFIVNLDVKSYITH